MKKTLLTFFISTLFITSQTSDNLIILNEGYYDFTNQEIIEPVSIGVYFPSTEIYEEVVVIDGVRFASDMIVDGDILYVAADNKILKYQIGSFELINEIEVQGARNLLIHNNNLFISRGDYDYDTWSPVVFDSYLLVYNKDDFSFVTQFDTENGPAWSTQNLVSKDDQVFVAINNGFEWNNEKGLVGVIDANNLTYTNEFDLGENGTNPDNMVLKGDYLLTVNNKNWSGSSVSRINLINNEVITEDLADLSTGCGTSALRGDFLNYQVSQGSTVHKYDYVNMETFGVEEGMNLNFYEIIESSDNLFYASSTDFFSYGEVYVFDENNEVINSFSTGISPGVFAFYSSDNGGCSDNETLMTLNYTSLGKSTFSVSVYPVEELYSATLSDGSGEISSCFPTELENECISVEVDGNLTWSLSWIGTGGNSNEWLTSESISDFATYYSNSSYYFGELCGFFAGCIDELACNYNDASVFDDGSCVYAEEYYDCDGNCINDEDGDGICDELDSPCDDLVDNDAVIEENFGAFFINDCPSLIDFLFDSYNYSEYESCSWNGSPMTDFGGLLIYDICPCSCDGVEEPVDVYGCTDENACNYDINATIDNGTCGLIDDCGDCQVPYCYDIVTNQPSYINQSDCDGVWVGNDPSDDYWLGSQWNPYWNSGCNSSNIEINSSKKIILITDILGRNSKELSYNNPQFIIYNDGSVEKVFKVK